MSTRPSSDTASSDRKRKKGKPPVSCAECRRLKLKCDRKVPCCNCIKKQCRELCPDGTRPAVRQTISKNDNTITTLTARLEHAEKLLHEQGLSLEGTPGSPLDKNSNPRTYEETLTSPFGIASGSLLQGVDRLAQSIPNDQISIPTRRSPISSARSQRKSTTATRLDSIPPTGSPTQDFTETANHYSFDYDVPAHSAMQQSQEHAIQYDYGQHVQANTRQPASPKHSGSLLVDRGGRSRYLGHTAASEWLQDQENRVGLITPEVSRMPSPVPSEPPTAQHGSHATPQSAAVLQVTPGVGGSFPFETLSGAFDMKTLLGLLPPSVEGDFLVDAFYRYFSWHYNICPRESFQLILDEIYSHKLRYECSQDCPSERTDATRLGLVFIVLAIGVTFNLEIAPEDPAADRYYRLAKVCMSKGGVLGANSIPTIQTIHLMGHFVLLAEKDRSGDLAWPLWGMATRMLQAMGLHRDGARWSLEPEMIEDRRRIFWECYAVDIFQANCFSRPSGISLDHIDTLFPIEPKNASRSSNPAGVSGFFKMKYRLSQMASAVLYEACRTEPSSYEYVENLWQQILCLERTVPYHLRCRASTIATPSAWPDPETASSCSPDVTRGDLHLTFQQHTLAINICEAILFLQRPYFAKALHDRPDDPSLSKFGASYLAIVERCYAILQIVRSLFTLYTPSSLRHWYLWYHAFSAAICLCTIVSHSPKSPLARFALTEVDGAIQLYTTAVSLRPSGRMTRNLHKLCQLRAKAYEMWDDATNSKETSGSSGDVLETDGDDIDSKLLGWRTRLIERSRLTDHHEAPGACIKPKVTSWKPSVPMHTEAVSFADLWPDLELKGHDFAVYAAEFGVSTG